MKLTHAISITAGILSSVNFALAKEPVWDANKVVLSSEKLSDGVFYFHAQDAEALKEKGGAAATTGGFKVDPIV